MKRSWIVKPQGIPSLQGRPPAPLRRAQQQSSEQKQIKLCRNLGHKCPCLIVGKKPEVIRRRWRRSSSSNGGSRGWGWRGGRWGPWWRGPPPCNRFHPSKREATTSPGNICQNIEHKGHMITMSSSNRYYGEDTSSFRSSTFSLSKSGTHSPSKSWKYDLNKAFILWGWMQVWQQMWGNNMLEKTNHVVHRSADITSPKQAHWFSRFPWNQNFAKTPDQMCWNPCAHVSLPRDDWSGFVGPISHWSVKMDTETGYIVTYHSLNMGQRFELKCSFHSDANTAQGYFISEKWEYQGSWGKQQLSSQPTAPTWYNTMCFESSKTTNSHFYIDYLLVLPDCHNNGAHGGCAGFPCFWNNWFLFLRIPVLFIVRTDSAHAPLKI